MTDKKREQLEAKLERLLAEFNAPRRLCVGRRHRIMDKVKAIRKQLGDNDGPK